MKQLHYGEGILYVSTDICAAVFRYAVALANGGKSDIVRIPILFEGKRVESELVIGPASQLFCTPADDSDVDMEDVALIEDLQVRSRMLGPSVPAKDESFLTGAENFDEWANAADVDAEPLPFR